MVFAAELAGKWLGEGIHVSQAVGEPKKAGELGVPSLVVPRVDHYPEEAQVDVKRE